MVQLKPWTKNGNRSSNCLKRTAMRNVMSWWHWKCLIVLNIVSILHKLTTYHNMTRCDLVDQQFSKRHLQSCVEREHLFTERDKRYLTDRVEMTILFFAWSQCCSHAVTFLSNLIQSPGSVLWELPAVYIWLHINIRLQRNNSESTAYFLPFYMVSMSLKLLYTPICLAYNK